MKFGNSCIFNQHSCEHSDDGRKAVTKGIRNKFTIWWVARTVKFMDRTSASEVAMVFFFCIRARNF